ncbi:ABC-type uncharacterized transport system, substrate-binding protein [Natronincola peptidivorans]|uniref:ABC-type uncharacterized transport system, substrate-binding protein n=1 Tax=Natronincola peptidivorans TaxID=426128 RepID=A0A1I0CEK4_9FIRM|nr:ABC transporter substrate binding protein [Natronincola peptidivorans]SET17880.1 ABC-type uncharacterized transport system, substrate-binding protein [Natronincola peptidivorans]
MKRAMIKIVCTLMIFLVSMQIVTIAMPGSGDILSNSPDTNDGNKWRIGYCESEPFLNFTGSLYGLIFGLNESGWISVNLEEMPYEIGQEDSLIMWNWLAAQDTGPYIEFVQDAYYSLYRPGDEEAVHKRLTETKDIDLMVAKGTYAGRLLSNDDHNTPVMVFSTTNAVSAGIIKSDIDSGRDHIWAHMDSDRYKRQIQVFYDIFQFKKLGVVYEDSPVGRIYAALDDIEELADILGYEVITYTVDEARDDEDRERYHREVLEAHKKLATQVDAMYLTAGTRDINKISYLLTPFYEAGIPVFSQLGAQEVRHGALLSLYRADFSGIGRFGADNVTRVLKGAKPRELSQIYGDTPSIVLNLKVADRIGYKAPFEILLSADEIYNRIEGEY